ncbi:MAG: 4-hydroxy-tetrahydrodipicolinate reductase [Bacteroidota bacterium]
MRIGLLGYGKMGKTIEALSKDRDHSITLKIDQPRDHIDFNEVDVAIDFSLPSAAVSIIKAAIKAGVPIISGTTGWLEQHEDVVDYCNKHNGAFLYASNFSLGVNIFFELNRNLAKLMGSQDSYTISLEEIHHTQKLDAPSGTAISLAEQIIGQTAYENWTLEPPKGNEIPIVAKRIEKVPGTHVVTYESEIDTIKISHEAHNRKGFALGAIVAAEWIRDKKGVFSMKDVLNIG